MQETDAANDSTPTDSSDPVSMQYYPPAFYYPYMMGAAPPYVPNDGKLKTNGITSSNNQLKLKTILENDLSNNYNPYSSYYRNGGPRKFGRFRRRRYSDERYPRSSYDDSTDTNVSVYIGNRRLSMDYPINN